MSEMNQDGDIKIFTQEELAAHEGLQKKLSARMGAQFGTPPKEERFMVPLTDREAKFFMSRTSFFRAHWAKKMKKGLTAGEQAILKELCDDFWTEREARQRRIREAKSAG